MKLFLCEKPSQAQDIGRVVLGGLSKDCRKNGYLQKGNIVISWAVGHILTDATPEKYGQEFENWNNIHALPVIPQQWIKEIPPKVSGQFKIIANLLKKADEVIIAADADREGEVIAREILDYCKYKGKISRFWTSGLDEKSVRTALGKIKPNAATLPLYYAGLARQKADWLVGMNLTRAYTVAYGQGQGKERVLSIGRVQTPTLALVVRRDETIANFEPYEHYGITIECKKDNGQTFLAHWQIPDELKNKDGHCVSLEHIKKITGSLKEVLTYVKDAKTEHKKTPPPLPYSLSELQKEASRKFNCTANDVLKVAQALYEKHKLTTYPRTPCQYLPQSQQAEVASVLNAVKTIDPTIAKIVEQTDPNRESRVWNDNQVNKHSHHAIIPTTNLSGSLNELNALERKIYELIRCRYIAQFYPDYEYATQTVILQINSNIYKGVGQTPLKQGWKVLFEVEKDDKQDQETQSQMPQVKTGERVVVIDAKINKKKTTPPPPFTEASLLEEMKTLSDFFKTVEDEQIKKVLRATLGLGTEATRAAIIERLLQVEYLQRSRGKIIATDKGKRLISLIPKDMADPVTTAKWEMALSAIEQGQVKPEQFMQLQENFVRELVGKAQAVVANKR